MVYLRNLIRMAKEQGIRSALGLDTLLTTVKYPEVLSNPVLGVNFDEDQRAGMTLTYVILLEACKTKKGRKGLKNCLKEFKESYREDVKKLKSKRNYSWR